MARPTDSEGGGPAPAVIPSEGDSRPGRGGPDANKDAGHGGVAELFATADWKLFALGYGALWLTLTMMVDAGPTANLAAALALSIAGGATVIYLPHILDAAGLATK